MPRAEILSKVMMTGEEYPGFNAILSGTPLGIYTESESNVVIRKKKVYIPLWFYRGK